MRIHYFQHVPFEGLGMIADWAGERGHTLSRTAFYEQAISLPDIEDYDALTVMGGPMGVYEEDAYPWLKQEKGHIRAAIDAGKPVLGICLGAQLIAASLGAKVAPHSHKEIGWFPVAVEDSVAGHPILSGLNPAMTVLHWHGDRFEIPVGAVRLMSSAACDNQAFLYGKHVLGLQFHLEMDAPAVEAILESCGHELVKEEWIQTAGTIRQKTSVSHTRRSLFMLLDNWASTLRRNYNA